MRYIESRDMLNTREVAELLGSTHRAIRGARERGTMPRYDDVKHKLWTRETILAWAAENPRRPRDARATGTDTGS